MYEKYKTELTIILVSFNVKDLLSRCINSIVENNIKSTEIIVVENNSSDNTISMIKNRFPDVTLIKNSENRGFAAACNQGIQISKGKYVLLLNPDTVIRSNTLKKCYEYMENNPDAGILGCKILNPDSTIAHSIRDFPNFLNVLFESLFLTKLFKKSRIFGKYHGTCYDYSEIREVNVLLGAFLFIRRKLIEEIGLLDERFFIYSEETDFCLRAKKNGWKNIFYPYAEIEHIHGGSTQKVRVKSFMYLHSSLNKFFRKHYSYSYALLCRLILFTGVCLRMVFWLIVSLLSVGKKKTGKFRVYLNTFLLYIGLRKV